MITKQFRDIFEIIVAFAHNMIEKWMNIALHVAHITCEYC